MKQISLSDSGFVRKPKVTRRQVFLDEMTSVVPWSRLMALIEPHYPKAGAKGGRPPKALSAMLRIHFMQQWFNLSDPGMEEALHDMPVMRRFAGIDTGEEDIPDETTILKFRRLLETHQLAERLFAEVNALLEENGLLLRQGTLVDATLISAPSSTKNREGARDPEMHQTKKGNQWYFGMKAHIGADADSGLVHTVIGTAANVNDVTQAHGLLHGKEKEAYGDAGYAGAEKRPEVTEATANVRWKVAMRPGKRRALDLNHPFQALADQFEKGKASIRAKVEHPFRVVKRQFGFIKVRYRGLAKNTAQLMTLFSLSNLWMMRRVLMPSMGEVRP
jgi:transposase, IS5 family